MPEPLRRLFGVEDPEIKSDIGTRHGEKLYESLLSREELQHAEDQGNYYRVPLDARSLEFKLYLDEGEKSIIEHDYTSHNTERLDVAGVKRLLLQTATDKKMSWRRSGAMRESPSEGRRSREVSASWGGIPRVALEPFHHIEPIASGMRIWPTPARLAGNLGLRRRRAPHRRRQPGGHRRTQLRTQATLRSRLWWRMLSAPLSGQ